MHRIVPEIGAIELPSGIPRGERSHFAAGLDELLELMTSILTLAMVRKTGTLPTLRCASNAATTAICVAVAAGPRLPERLVFEGSFVRRMLRIWDGRAHRDPEDASTYLHVTQGEYIVGIGRRDLVDAVARDDDAAVERGLEAATRVTAVWHGGGS